MIDRIATRTVDQNAEILTDLAKKIWENPETAFQEFKSTEILCELLEKEGFEVEKNLAGIATAFSGRDSSADSTMVRISAVRAASSVVSGR